MPIYQYRCDACHQTCELIRKFSDPPLTTCPHCHAEALRKLIAPVGVIFKGTGFHKNDYSSTGATKSSSTPSTTTSESTGTSEAPKTDAAPAAKTESSSASGGDKPSSGGSDKVA